MNIDFADIAITSVETVTAFDLSTGAWKFTLDELSSVSISQSEETTDITGKQGRKLAKIKKNKTVTISGENGLISGGLLEMQTGSDLENTTTEVMWTDYLTVSSNAATTSYTAVGTTGAEIINLYVKNADGTLGDELTQGSTATSGVFTYTPSSKKLAFSGVSDDTEIVVFYKRQITADVLENYSDTYSGTCTLYIDALAEDTCNNVYRIQFYFPRADFSGEFSLDMGDSQTVHSFEVEALSGGCGVSSGLYFTYTIFGVNTEDAT
ncbi:MAG: hypothetical protein LUD69_07930 [Oscillospiraceae bacterium]|nr:hypothetical protein [Oscillospiraceae bacterium]